MRVRDLVPGMKFESPVIDSAVFIIQSPHPCYSSLQLVIWRLANGEISFDALSLMQELGEPIHQTPTEWREQVRQAMNINTKEKK